MTHIWILLSDTICQLNQLHTNREAALAPWAGCRRPGVDEVAFVLCAPGHFDGSGQFVFFLYISRLKKHLAECKTIQISNWLGIIATGVDALQRRNSWYRGEVQI